MSFNFLDDQIKINLLCFDYYIESYLGIEVVSNNKAAGLLLLLDSILINARN